LSSYTEATNHWLVEEAIPHKHMKAIMNDRMENLVMEKGTAELERFGNFLRYLLKDGKTEMEDQLFQGIKARVEDWMECESWTSLAPGKLWDNTAILLTPLFSEEHCKGTIVFNSRQFTKLVKMFQFKDEYGDFDFRGCFAVALLKSLIEKGIIKNEFEIRKFWSETALHLNELFNEDSKPDFFDSLKKKQMTYLYNNDLVKFDPKFKDDFDYMAVNDLIKAYHDADSFCSEFKQFVNVEKIHEQALGIAKNKGVWAGEHLASVTYIVMEQISKAFLMSSASMAVDSLKERFEQIIESSVYILCDFESTVGEKVPEKQEALSMTLEIEILYAVENFYCEMPDNKKNILPNFMEVIWNVYLLNKETILDKWKDEELFGKTAPRGIDSKARVDMDLTLTGFVSFVKSSNDEDEENDEIEAESSQPRQRSASSGRYPAVLADSSQMGCSRTPSPPQKCSWTGLEAEVPAPLQQFLRLRTRSRDDGGTAAPEYDLTRPSFRRKAVACNPSSELQVPYGRLLRTTF